jgi:uncharacterized protein YhaN
MRLKSLGLKAFGPFTDRTLEFNSAAPGLHIIYGPNEAGKSSSLRALKALLYGFAPQTPDNFLHNYDQLLVSGCLENNDGKQLHFQRRKKRLGDIIDEAGDPLPPDTLAPFLHGVDAEIFASLYGIDHDTLVRGGKEILAQKGEVGQALFAAGAGISSLKEVIDQLEKEAGELFKPTGQVPEINRAIKRCKELQKQAKTAGLSCRDWKEHHKALKIAEEERAALERERDEKDVELRRLERLAQAIPELGLLKSYREQLEALGAVIILPPDFAENHRQIVQAIREAELQLQKDTEHVKKLEARRQALSFNRNLLEHSEKIDDFHQRLGEYRKGLKDRPEREGMRISLRREAAQLLQQVRPDLRLEAIEPLRAVLLKKKSIQRLSAEYEAVNQQLIQAKNQATAAGEEHREAAQGLAALGTLPDTGRLFQAVKLAHKSGDIDGLLEKNRREIDQGRKDCLAELQRLGFWSGDLQSLIELALPLSETVQQFERQYNELVDEKRLLKKEQKTIAQELTKARTEIQKGAYVGEIPSEEILLQTRQKREYGWQLLRRRWLANEDVTSESLAYAPDQPLDKAYEEYVGQVDGIADRLRREADRVATAAALRAQVESQQQLLADFAESSAVLRLRQEKIDATWIALWQAIGISPLSPKEMSSWLASIDQLRYKAGDILKKEQEIKRVLQQRHTLRQTIFTELHGLHVPEIPSGEALGPVLLLAETFLETATRRQAARDRCTTRLESAEKNIHLTGRQQTTAQEAMGKWQEQWQRALAGLALSGEITTFEAIDLLEILQTCFARVKEAADLQKRIDGIDRDARELEREVRSLLTLVAPGALELPLDLAIVHVRTLLGQSQNDCTLHDKLSEEIDALLTETAGAQKTLLSARAQMDEILLIARSTTPEELASVIRTFEASTRLTNKISDTTANLAKISAGMEIEEISRQAAAVNADELPGRIEALRRDIALRIHPEINRISQVIGEQTGKLAAMDGNAKAAELAEEKEQELAGIRRLAERYTLVKLAAKILQLEIERYREEHQDPVLLIGSKYFREMTLGSFTGLRTDVDDQGLPVLIGLRPGNKRVPVEGMSSGTRDQLYLALRLATLAYRLESHEPMPFIVDDILINFDDRRSRATLQALARLSARNQVILFTHHRQIVEETERLADQDSVVVHTL